MEPEANQTEVRTATCQWKCQVDASWQSATEGVGVGFVLFEDERVIMVGLRKYMLVASPLQAEAECLSWAMKEIIQRGFKQVRFESTCQQLVHITQQSSAWPALEPEMDEIDFFRSEFSLSYLARSENIYADCLAKANLSRYNLFSFVDVKVPPWLVHEASLFTLNFYQFND